MLGKTDQGMNTWMEENQADTDVIDAGEYAGAPGACSLETVAVADDAALAEEQGSEPKRRRTLVS